MDQQILIAMERVALTGLFMTLKDHKEFWDNWIQMRTGPMANIFTGNEEEINAAKGLEIALLEFHKLQRLKDANAS